MKSLLLLGVSSFFLSVILTPVCRDFFRKRGFVDHPGDRRKIHKDPIARVGGVAIAFAYILAFVLLLMSPLRHELIQDGDLPFILRIAPAGLLIFATGLLDDLLNLKPWQKLIGQFLAAGWACWAGVRVSAFAGHSMGMWLALPLTILWLVACTNAFNFIDGIDGLAAGLGFFATVTTLVAALLQDNVYLALATVPLAGALLGFLGFNFHPASIFLGDSGSLTVGFMLGCFGVVWGQKSATLLGMVAPLMVIAVPMLDICLSVARRLIRARPIFSADRGHIHHQLLDRGLGPRGVALVLYSVTALGAVFSLLQSVYHNQHSRLIIIVFCVISCIGIRNLNYIEFDVARRMLFGGEFSTVLNAHLFLKAFESSLRGGTDIAGRRQVVEEACGELGFSRVRMSLRGVLSDTRLTEAREDQYELLIPLGASDYINLTRAFFCKVHPTIVTSFIDVLRTHFSQEATALAAADPHGKEASRLRIASIAG